MAKFARPYVRVHPAVVGFTYAGLIFFGGFWNWVFRGAIPTFMAASVSAVFMLIPSTMCLAIPENRRLGSPGIYLGVAFSAIISSVYSWRAYLAYFQQSNIPKTMLISTQVVLGIVTCLLLYANRHYGRSTS